jgi:hypothetical protein
MSGLAPAASSCWSHASRQPVFTRRDDRARRRPRADAIERLEPRLHLASVADYDAWYRWAVDSLAAKYTPAWVAQQTSNASNTSASNGNHVAVAQLAAAEALLYQRNPSAHAAYGPAALDAVTRLRNDWFNDTGGGARVWNIDTCFFYAEPLFTAVRALKTTGLIAAGSALDTDLKQIAKDVARPFTESDAQNRAASAAVGTAAAIDCWPDLNTDRSWPWLLNTTTTSSYATWWDYVGKVMSSIRSLSDSWDHSNNYNNIYTACVIRLADFTGNGSFLSTSGNLWNMYSRFRDAVSPAGDMPCFGDDYTGMFGFNRFPMVFERMGTTYADGSFRWAADRLFRAKGGSPDLDGAMYVGLALNQNWVNDALAVTLPSSTTRSWRRVISAGNLQPDILILNPSRAAGQPYVGSTGLWASVPGQNHMHPGQAGAITLFESQGTQFLKATGYHNERPEMANQVVVTTADASFPYLSPIPSGYTTQTNLGLRPTLAGHGWGANAAGDQFGWIAQNGFGSGSSSNARRSILLREGILVTFDKLTPDATAAGKFGGPAWQLMGSPGSPVTISAGPDWVAASGFLNAAGVGWSDKRLLVKFDSAPGRVTGAQAPPPGYFSDGVTGVRAAFAREPLTAGVPAAFMSVLMPYDAATSASAAAARVSVTRASADAGVATIANGRITIRVSFNADGTWSVTRTTWTRSVTTSPPILPPTGGVASRVALTTADDVLPAASVEARLF